MIRHEGQEWGTATEIAQALGPDVTEAMVRNWANPRRSDGLARVRMTDADGRPEVRYRLDQAAEIEARKRLAGRGRPRQLDTGALVA